MIPICKGSVVKTAGATACNAPRTSTQFCCAIKTSTSPRRREAGNPALNKVASIPSVSTANPFTTFSPERGHPEHRVGARSISASGPNDRNENQPLPGSLSRPDFRFLDWQGFCPVWFAGQACRVPRGCVCEGNDTDDGEDLEPAMVPRPAGAPQNTHVSASSLPNLSGWTCNISSLCPHCGLLSSRFEFDAKSSAQPTRAACARRGKKPSCAVDCAEVARASPSYRRMPACRM